MGVNNGRITAPVSVADVMTALGVASTDVGRLCSNQHNMVNRWSFFKPIRHPKITPLTDAEFFEADGGLTITAYSRATTLYNAKIAGETWGYSPPTGGVLTPFRLSDFKGYDHNAVTPFLFETPNTPQINANFRLDCTNEFMDILQYGSFDEFTGVDLQRLQLGVLFSETTSIPNKQSVYYYQVTGVFLLDEIASRINLPLNPAYFSIGQIYDIIPVLTMADIYQPNQFYLLSQTDPDMGSWIMFPGPKITVTVGAQTGHVTVELLSYDLAGEIPALTFNQLVFRFANTGGTTFMMPYTLTINTELGYPGYEVNDGVNLPAGGTATLTLNPNFTSANDRPRVTIEFSAYGATNSESWRFD